MTTTIFPIKRERVRKPTAPRTCCPSHHDTCKFGRDHLWCSGFYKDGVWNNADMCGFCDEICTAEIDGRY